MEAQNGPVDSTRGVHLACLGVVGAVFLVVLILGYSQPLVFEDVPGIEPTRIALVQQRLDPNTATWSELARLPEIGESTARRIVQFRDQPAHPGDLPRPAGQPVFRFLADLDAVPGIGPHRLERLRPYLKFPQEQP
ncbi:MAG: hypothetical protein AMXMBFR13_13350 [Phycisphaerae bacterium]|jgi:DNA uptake protein ComE-like DNA-binding protein